MPQEKHELITIEITAGELDGMGLKPYYQMPRIGEWVEVADDDGKALIFEVVMIAHSTGGGTADVYVKRLGDLASVVGSLLKGK